MFSTHPPPYDKVQHRLAAVLVCGRDAALCGVTAADHLGIAKLTIDLAPDLDEAELEVVLVAAESKGLLKRHRLDELIAERAGRPGIGKLASITALEPAIVRSELELLMLPIVRMAGVGRPLVNHPIDVGRRRPLVVDFAWPELRMVVEADSQRFHGDWERAAADRERDQLLALAGWRSHRFVRDRLVLAREDSADRLRELAAARAAEVAGG